MLNIAEIDTPLGAMVLVARDARLCALAFHDAFGEARASLARRFGGEPLESTDLSEIARPIRAYFAGDLRALDPVAIDVDGPPLHRRVWDALRALPAGATISYGALARQVGVAGAARAVGSANAQNPVALVVPCHRVVRGDGTLGGYAGGLGRKRWLIAHEVRYSKNASAAWLTMEPSPGSTVCS